MIEKTITTGVAYTDANSIGPDASGVQLDILVAAAVQIELFAGYQGQIRDVGQLTLDQSTTFAGGVGCKVRNAPGGAATPVTLRLWQTKDPLPTPVPVGATALSVTTSVGSGTCSLATAIGALYVDVTGASVSFTTVGTSASLLIFGSADFQLAGAASGGTIIACQAMLDGVLRNSVAVYSDDGSATQRVTAGINPLRVGPLAVGAHILKLQTGRLAGAGANWQVGAASSSIGYVLVDQ